jgi:hypothetical protein
MMNPVERDQMTLLLQRIVALRVRVEMINAQNQRSGDDICGDEYNALCSWALSLFPSSPLLHGKLILMPDAATQMAPQSGTQRLLARLCFLETNVALEMGVDPSSLPEARGAPSQSPSQMINISNSTIHSFASNLQGLQIVTASLAVSHRGQEINDLLRELRTAIEGSSVDRETRYDALKDTAAMQAELEKNRPVLDRVVGLGKGIVTAVVTAAPTVDKLIKLVQDIQPQIK